MAEARSVIKGHIYLSNEQVIRLAAASGEKKTPVLTLAYCGIRWAEATGLRVKDVDLEKGRFVIEVGKGKKPDELVFPDKHGYHMRHVRVSKGSWSWFKTALVTAGLPTMVLHDLRHTSASLAVQAGGNVKVIQRMLGHASAAMTLDVYSDLFDDDLDSVSTALDAAYRAASPLAAENNL
jgi:integrase